LKILWDMISTCNKKLQVKHLSNDDFQASLRPPDHESHPALQNSCLFLVLLLVGRMEIAISQLCAVRLSLNLVETSGWYPRLACMFWFQDSIVFYIVKKQTNNKNAEIAKNAVLENFPLI
jgi:hypothetical protein